MNRLIVINSIIFFIVCSTFVSSLQNKMKIDAYKELIKCTHTECEAENSALKALYRDELEQCLKKCNVDVKKKLSTFSEEDRKKLKECFKANDCKMPIEHLKQHRDAPEFKALRQCAEKKCRELFDKVKEVDNSFDQPNQSN